MTKQQTEKKAASYRVSGRDKIGTERIIDMKFKKGDRVRYNESGLRWLMGYAHFCLLQTAEPSLAETIALVHLCFDIGTVEDTDEGTSSMTIRWDSTQVKKECAFKWFRKAEPGDKRDWCFHGADHSETPALVNDGLGIHVARPDYDAFQCEASRPTEG